MASETKYVTNDGILLRVTNPRSMISEIYRGNGVWEKFPGEDDKWEYSMPLSPAEAKRWMAEFDRSQAKK